MATAISFFICLALTSCHSGIVSAGIAKDNVNDVCDSRIVGGCRVKPGEIPYQLSLRYGDSHYCGAALISPQLALTAGHCAKNDEVSNLVVVAGEHSLSEPDGTEQYRRVQKKIVHEGYNNTNLANDIALLKLSSPFNVNNKNVAIIPLPRADYNDTGDIIVTGWGSQNPSRGLSDSLMKVQLPIVSDKQCRENYPEYPVADSMICAGYAQGGKDSCQGDSGGPLVSIKDKVLVGLVSWGIGCARPNRPGVNTEVAKFVDWIKKNSASLLADEIQASNEK